MVRFSFFFVSSWSHAWVCFSDSELRWISLFILLQVFSHLHFSWSLLGLLAGVILKAGHMTFHPLLLVFATTFIMACLVMLVLSHRVTVIFHCRIHSLLEGKPRVKYNPLSFSVQDTLRFSFYGFFFFWHYAIIYYPDMTCIMQVLVLFTGIFQGKKVSYHEKKLSWNHSWLFCFTYCARSWFMSARYCIRGKQFWLIFHQNLIVCSDS